MKIINENAFKYSVINPIKERISIAPMVDVTNNVFRFLIRYLTKHCFLYTEMISCEAVINTPKDEGRVIPLYYTEN